jgi:dipeptide/tripeptide permease
MSTAAATPQRTFMGHPIGLYVLFFTEMWERFSYYGMRALLMLYMLNFFRWSQKDASTYYKIYTSFVYVTPILGGFLADRFLGNRRAVIIGAVLMAVGHFLMAFEEQWIYISALAFLIMGNGFFKPNMSVQVGRLYAANDGRRDGAYTIFYMGINLGAFLAPLACGWLADNTVGGYHSGFTLAGIGMVLGLLIYVFGQPLVKELPPDTLIETSGATLPPVQGTEIKADEPPTGPKQPAEGEALTEAQAERTGSILGGLSAMVPTALYVIGGLMFAAAAVMIAMALAVPGLVDSMGLKEIVGPGDISNISNKIMIAIAGFCLLLLGYVAGQSKGGMRDRVLAIIILGVFVIFFWAAFEQAGNVLNVWADQNTNRYITENPKTPGVIPQVFEDKPKADDAPPERVGMVQHFINLFPNMVTLKPRPEGLPQEPEKTWTEWLSDFFNPVSTAWFQSINALAIFVIAPVFAWLWVYLDKRGWQPSIPFKMVLGLVMMSASMAIMWWAADVEAKPTDVAWARALPSGITTTASKQLAKGSGEKAHPFHAGRLNCEGNKLLLTGVLDKNECDHLIETSAPEAFAKSVAKLRELSATINDKEVKSVEVELDSVPDGFDMKYAGIKRSIVEFKVKDGKAKLIAYQKIVDKEVKGLLVAGGDREWRDTIHQLWVKGTERRVSSWWLFWSYILATLGELCLSPVGLSMVSKLAPTRFATMLMGVWLLTGAFGNFAAGAMGEDWSDVQPAQFFLLVTAIVAGSALVLLVLVKPMTNAMHGVK